MCLELEVRVGAKNSLHENSSLLHTIPDNTSLQKYAPKSIPQPPDLAFGHFLEPGAGSEGVSQKMQRWKCGFTIPNNTFFINRCSEVNGWACRPSLGTPFWAWSWLWGWDPKVYKMKLSPHNIHNNTSLPRDVLQSIAEPPDLPCRHLFEPGAGFEGGIQKSIKWNCLLKIFTTIPLYQEMFYSQ